MVEDATKVTPDRGLFGLSAIIPLVKLFRG
jgi:hypothetical protein